MLQLGAMFLIFWLNWTRSGAIINRHPEPDGGSVYLNQQRPLWILEDQVTQPDYERVVYSTQRPHYALQQQQQQKRQPPRFNHRYQQQQQHQRPQLQQQPPRSVFKLPRRLQLPSHYLPHQSLQQRQQQHQPRLIARSRQRAIPIRREQRGHEPRSQPRMPIFDSLPGEDSDRPLPVFIYNGPKGALILNTMLSARQYPMQEPVPGQTLYPPSAPIFRPKPIVERFRVPAVGGAAARSLNLTLIPFYAHEAISAPRMLSYGSDSTTERPAVVYAARAPAVDSTTPPKKRRPKKAKHYAAYRSPNEVQWQPPKAHALQLATTPTTPFPLTLASPLPNHRHTIDDADTTTTTPTYKLNYGQRNDGGTESDEEERFQIIYMDESLEKPTQPTKSPVLSSRYALTKEFYAFPVFTLGKLLRPETETEKQLPTFVVENTVDSPLEGTNGATAEQDKDNVDTWFILNSRYKGHHNHNDDYRLSSKYVQTVAAETTDATL